MFRKGPRPFYKLGDEFGLFGTSPVQTGEVRGDPTPVTSVSDVPDRRFQIKTSPSKGEVTLPKALEPAAPSSEHREEFRRPRNSKALFVDSAFFSARDHPTWEEQVKMARQIAASLSDATNRHSRGQNMFERRQKRSPRWIHQDEPTEDETETDSTPGGVPLTSEDYRGPTLTVQTKPMLELVMNPQGQLLDLESLRDKGVVINTESLSPELCAELIRDLHSAKGRGGQIFARRKKRAERWVVDEFHPEQSRPGERPTTQLPQPKPRHMPQPETVQTTADTWQAPRDDTWQQAREDTWQPTGLEAAPETEPAGMSVTIPPVRLEDLWQPSSTARFPTDGVYSSRAPQGWRSPGIAAAPAAPVFPEYTEPLAADTAADTDVYGTLPDTETQDTWDWSAQQQRQQRQPPPTATLFETPMESLRSMEERRRQGQSNYTPQAWSDRSAHCQATTFTVT